MIRMRLQDDDEIIDVVVNKKDSEEDYVLCVLSSGIGKRFRCRDLTEQRRGGKGSIYAKLSRENENVVAVKPCGTALLEQRLLRSGNPNANYLSRSFMVGDLEPDDQFMLITTTGAVVRVEASVVPFYKGRFARGVKLQKLKEDSEVIGVDLINKRIQEDTEDSVELVNPELASEELPFTGVGTESDDSEAVKDGDQT
uniref:DNA topoisomerase (ATP-hydrolyzing) n=1 Tax=Rhodosorus marinus TaxID=101924 RepID=A0A7S2ZF71_9RHOD|mmetsp:Transcript_1670/g.6243  ORF Transcript_1670/g.6243 Transcript_1670/m.6243 type:complete len:198 (+) Transcript_1670:691-1284(+)